MLAGRTLPSHGRGARRARRVGALVLGLALLVGPVVAPTAGGADEIADTRSEAERVADQIEALQLEATVLTEEYLEAQVNLETLDARIADASERAERSRTELDALAEELRAFAIETYIGGGVDVGTTALIGASDPNEVGRRRGYAAALSGDGADLADQYRGAAGLAESDQQALDTLRQQAEATQAVIEEKQAATEDSLAELRAVQDEIDDRLAALVAEEQARREAERQRAIEEEMRRNPPPAPVVEETAPAPADETAPSGEPEPEPEAPAPTTPAPPAPGPPAAPTPEPGPPPGPASGAQAAIAAARSVLGVPYRWGGESPSSGFDCSGLTLWAWRHGGKSLPHSSRAQYAMSRKIPVSQLQPGDLVFYNSPISHVGLYIGGGQMIHAPRTGKTVEIQSIYYWSALVGGGRI